VIAISYRAMSLLAITLAIVIPLSNTATNVIGLLLLTLCLLSTDRTVWRKIFTNEVVVAILVFVAISFLRCTASFGKTPEIIQALRKTSRLLYLPLFLSLFVANLRSVYSDVQATDQSRLRHGVLLGLLMTIILTAIVGLVHVDGPVFKDTIFTSMFVAYGVFVAMHYAFEYQQYRLWFAGIALLLSYYLFFINTGRIGQVGLVVLIGIFLWQRFASKLKTALFFGLGALCLAGILSLVPSSFVTRQTIGLRELADYMHTDDKGATSSSIGLRMIFAHNTWDLIKQRPVQGWGTGAFRAAFATHATQLREVGRVDNPHNQYLLTWLELGLAGLLSLLYIFWTMLRQFFLAKNLFGYLGFGLVCLFMLGCTLNSWLLDFTSSFFFVFIVSCLLIVQTKHYKPSYLYASNTDGVGNNT